MSWLLNLSLIQLFLVYLTLVFLIGSACAFGTTTKRLAWS